MTEMVDSAERFRTLTELGSCLLVEAAAGAGKTSLLAGRVVMLFAAGTDPRSITAITFTELAAGELRQRIASYLERILQGRIPDGLRLALPSRPSVDQADTGGHGVHCTHPRRWSASDIMFASRVLEIQSAPSKDLATPSLAELDCRASKLCEALLATRRTLSPAPSG
jgi:hypothetical protein